MNDNGLPKGYIPLDSEKKRREYWKYILGLFVFLVGSYTIKEIREDKAVNTVNRQGAAVASAVNRVSPQEMEYFQNFRKRVGEISLKYLSSEEFADWLIAAIKVSRGTATIDEINLCNFSWNKVRSSASASEKETLDEFGRLGQKLADIQK